MPPSDEETVLVEAVTPASPPATPAASTETEAESSTTKKTSVTVVTTTTTASSSSSASASSASGYEQWVKAHSGLARNIETMFFIAPQFVPVRGVAASVWTIVTTHSLTSVCCVVRMCDCRKRLYRPR